MPEIVNMKAYGSVEALKLNHPGKWLYVGRAMPTYLLTASPLANPFSSNRGAKAFYNPNPIDAYRRWLNTRIKKRDQKVIRELLKVKEDTVLVCWCSPFPCHAEIVIKAASYVCGLQELGQL